MRIECDEAPELQMEDVDELEIDGFHANGDHPPAPAIRLIRTRRAYVHDCASWREDAQMIELMETDSSDVREANNHALRDEN